MLHRDRRLRRERRFAIECLEPRHLLAADPVQLGQFLEFRLFSENIDWETPRPGVFSSVEPVTIGFQDTIAPWQPALVVDQGIEIDTNLGSEGFTIQATHGKHNLLAYLPNNNVAKAEALWEFQLDYQIAGEDLEKLICVDEDNLACIAESGGLEISGAAVTPITDPDLALKITNIGGGSTLVPTHLLMTQTDDAAKTTQLQLHGMMSLNASSPVQKAIKYLDRVNINIGDSATYFVTADALGEVNLVSKTGSGVWVDVAQDATGKIGSVEVDLVGIQFRWDQQNGEISLGGQLELRLTDDNPDKTTPFLLDVGDATTPGVTLKFNGDHMIIEHFQAAFVSGTKEGQYRKAINPAGLSIGIEGLFFLYDKKNDKIGLGGNVTMEFGPKEDDTLAGDFQNRVELTLGKLAQNEPGLFIEEGQIDTLNAEFIGDFTIGAFKLNGDVTVTYQRGDETTKSAGSFSGNLLGSIASIVSVGIELPERGLVYTSGDWDLAGGIGFLVNGAFEVKGFGFKGDNLDVRYARPDNKQGGKDHVWTIGGGVTLNAFFKATVELNDGTIPGLRIVNGDWDLEGIQIEIENLSLGVFEIKQALVDYHRTNGGKDYEVRAAGMIVIGTLFEVDFELDFEDGKPETLGVDFKAAGENPGIPVADTGLFISELGFEVEHLDRLNDLVVEGTVAVTYGESVEFEGRNVNLLLAEGKFLVDRHQFELVEADFSIMDGLIAQGSGSMTINWWLHEYKAKFDVSGWDGVFDVRGEVELNEFQQFTAFVDAGLRVPQAVPFIGGRHLADLDGIFVWDPVDQGNSLVAAWIDIDLLFTHLRGGLEYRFYPPTGKDHLRFIHGGDVTDLEKESTRDQDGWHSQFTKTVTGQPNQALFTFAWDNQNEIGDVSLTIPGVTTPVILRKGSTDAVDFVANAVKYKAQPVKELQGARRYAWLIAADATDDASAAYQPIPVGDYKVDVLTAEKVTGKLSVSEAFAAPEVTRVVMSQPSNSNQVMIQTDYRTGDPANTHIDLYYTAFPNAGDGVKINDAPIPVTTNQGTVATKWDISSLTWKRDYYVFARISDTTNSNGAPMARSEQSAVSKMSVTPYVDTYVTLSISPDVPVDRQAETLAGWPVIWQETDTAGNPIGTPLRRATDLWGQSGITATAGKHWSVTVAPASWDGFTPTPDAGQSSNPNGQLTITGLTGGTYAAPNVVVANFQNMISVHGQVALELSGNGQYEPGGVALPGRTVYNDLNNNAQLDAGEPRTLTDNGGFYDLRFPLPTELTDYTVRTIPDPNTRLLWLRKHPDSKTDFSYTGDVASYSISVDPTSPTVREVFDNRDFLATQPIIISGVAYVSGADGESYSTGATPVAGQTVAILNEQGQTIQSVETIEDGGYRFEVYQPGRYQVTTDVSQAFPTNVPSSNALAFKPASSSLPIELKTATGGPVYGLYARAGLNNAPSHQLPLIASGDFYQDGRFSQAFAAISSTKPIVRPDDRLTIKSPILLMIVKGADSPDQVTVQNVAVLDERDILYDQAQVPSVFAGARDQVLLATPEAYKQTFVTAYSAMDDTMTNVLRAGDAPGMTRLIGVAGKHDQNVFLMTDTAGNAWSLLTHQGDKTDPQVIASFDFSRGNGLRPSSQTKNGASSDHNDASLSRWASLTQGDFDGDGLPDYAFSATDIENRQAIAYLLSREGYDQVHAVPLNAWTTANSDVEFWTISITALDPDRRVDQPAGIHSLAVHRTVSGQQAASDVLILAPNPVSDEALANGRPATSFVFDSSYSVPTTVGNDSLVDLNSDGYLDLLLANTFTFGGPATALVNQGNGDFAPPVTFDEPQGTFGSSLGLLTTGRTTLSSGFPAPPTPLVWDLGLAVNGPTPLPEVIDHEISLGHSYWVDASVPGSFGGYHFGVSEPPENVFPSKFSGAAYIDANANGRQDPGERNLVRQRIEVTPEAPDSSTSVFFTDDIGRWFSVSHGAGGSGVAIGNSILLASLDYSDTFTLGAGDRVDLVANQFPSGDQLKVEFHDANAPQVEWTNDRFALTNSSNTTSDYRGDNGAGTLTGMGILAQEAYLGLEYGLRDNYTVQFDAVYNGGQLAVVSGKARDRFEPIEGLAVVFSGNTLSLTSAAAGSTVVRTGTEGNTGDPIWTGVGSELGRWNNYAVNFDQASNALRVYVDQTLLVALDLTRFAGGTYLTYSNGAVSLGSTGFAEHTWFDNFQLGAPGAVASYLVIAPGLSPRLTQPASSPGYTVPADTDDETGFDFGVKYSTVANGGIQGVVYVDNDGSNSWSPTDAPYVGMTVFLDLDRNGQLDAKDLTTTTDAHGAYRFAGLRPGDYLVRQHLPVGVTQVTTTQPLGGVQVKAGETTSAINFGDRKSSLSRDFNHDTRTDYVRLVAADDGTTDVYIDVMAGHALGRSQFAGTFDSSLWRIVAVGDFDGDNHHDLLFQHTDNGELAYWKLHNGEVLRWESLVKPGKNWKVVAAADLDRHGTADLLLQHRRSGRIRTWLMDGADVLQTLTLTKRLGRNQVVEGLIDWEGDGTSDLLLHDSRTGSLEIWVLQDAKVETKLALDAIDPGLHLIGADNWSMAPSHGATLFWQHAATNEIVRWEYASAEGVSSQDRHFSLGGSPKQGRFLDIQAPSPLFIRDDTIFVTGTDERDDVTLSIENETTVVIQWNGDEFDVGNRTFNKISIDTGRGQDHIRILGGPWTDTPIEISGGNGYDTYELSTTDASIRIDDSGNNLLDFTRASANVSVDLSRTSQSIGSGNTLILLGSIRDVTGSAFDDQLSGNELDNRIDGRAGSDALTGRNGNDRLDGGIGNDLLRGNAGNDILQGGRGSDILLGGSGNDLLKGRRGDDILVGGSDRDQLWGHDGRDVMIAGLGADVLHGGDDDDLLISGHTIYDDDLQSLDAIWSEWTSEARYRRRAHSLRDGRAPHLNGVRLNQGVTIFADLDVDELHGDAGRDLFFASDGEEVDKGFNELWDLRVDILEECPIDFKRRGHSTAFIP